MVVDNHQREELWGRCLERIVQQVSPHVFDVWFSPIVCESYDDEKNAVVLSLPNRYVYEYLEEVQQEVLAGALTEAFGKGVHLNYRISKDQNTVLEYPKAPEILKISMPNARKRMKDGLAYYLGERAKWIPAYDQVAQWLADNKGRGLLCFGPSGLGKTLVCERIIPIILGRKIKTVTAREMNTGIDELLNERAVIIDDLGKEPVEHKSYGNVRLPFFELCDAAEKKGILLIITTNLSTTAVPGNKNFSSSIEERYGADVISRLRAITTVARLMGRICENKSRTVLADGPDKVDTILVIMFNQY